MRKNRGTLVLGLGNTIAGDDGVGLRIAERLEELLKATPVPGTSVRDGNGDLLDLLHLVPGCRRLVILDSVVPSTGQARPGKVHFFTMDGSQVQRVANGVRGGSHWTRLNEVIQLGRVLGLAMPAEILVLAVEVGADGWFSEKLSETVKPRVEELALAVHRFLHDGGTLCQVQMSLSDWEQGCASD